jgi:hypothetical protein
MQFYGQAASAANRILDAFKSGQLPKALATVFIRRDDALPCRAWSWSNQLLTALNGHDDARGFRQWESVGRFVKKGNGRDGGALGWYRPGSAIALGVENLATWAHELVHAADDRLGALKGSEKVSAEVVAELGGAVLLHAIGRESDADVGGAWRYIDSWSGKSKLSPIAWCERLLKRACDAVALILKTADDTATGAACLNPPCVAPLAPESGVAA